MLIDVVRLHSPIIVSVEDQGTLLEDIVELHLNAEEAKQAEDECERDFQTCAAAKTEVVAPGVKMGGGGGGQAPIDQVGAAIAGHPTAINASGTIDMHLGDDGNDVNDTAGMDHTSGCSIGDREGHDSDGEGRFDAPPSVKKPRYDSE